MAANPSFVQPQQVAPVPLQPAVAPDMGADPYDPNNNVINLGTGQVQNSQMPVQQQQFNQQQVPVQQQQVPQAQQFQQQTVQPQGYNPYGMPQQPQPNAQGNFNQFGGQPQQQNFQPNPFQQNPQTQYSNVQGVQPQQQQFQQVQPQQQINQQQVWPQGQGDLNQQMMQQYGGAATQFSPLQNPVSDLLAQLDSQQSNASNPAMTELLNVIKEQGEQNKQIMERLATKGDDGPDYLSMDSSQLIQLMQGDPEKGQAPKVNEILRSVYNKALTEATNKHSETTSKLENKINAMVTQHNTLQAQAALSNLRGKYSQHDPNFGANLQKVSAILTTDKGKALLNAFPENAGLEQLYLMVHSANMSNPQYGNQLMQLGQQMAVQSNLQKFNAGNVQGVTQTQQTFPVMQQQQNPAVKTDAQVMGEILSADPYVSSTLPNITVQM